MHAPLADVITFFSCVPLQLIYLFLLSKYEHRYLIAEKVSMRYVASCMDLACACLTGNQIIPAVYGIHYFASRFSMSSTLHRKEEAIVLMHARLALPWNPTHGSYFRDTSQVSLAMHVQQTFSVCTGALKLLGSALHSTYDVDA